jgi:threonyl-tRNA synthetase
MQSDQYLKAAQELDLLVHIPNQAGIVSWNPNGYKVYNRLQAEVQRVHEELGYLQVKSPDVISEDLLRQSGHYEKYADYLFKVPGHEHSGLVLRPMSCPNHIQIYQSQRRSFKELPLRLFEFGNVYRNESSGSLKQLFRQRQFCQDDSHIFAREDQIQYELQQFLSGVKQLYARLDLVALEYAISLRPKNKQGDDALWDRAENSLREACNALNVSYIEQPGEGAFYGPKLEIGVRDKNNKLWQLGVFQLDYVLPKAFNLSFVASDQSKQEPVIIHHAMLGSLERMVGILLEIHGVHLPACIHPHPHVVVPVSQEKHMQAAQDYVASLAKKGVRALLDINNGSVGHRVRSWKKQGCRTIELFGDQELERAQE